MLRRSCRWGEFIYVMVAGGRVLRSSFPQTGKAPFRRQDRVSQPKHLVLVSLTLVKQFPTQKGAVISF
jgi:hypothetical protein